MKLSKGTLGNAIRQARILNNLTQEELAERVGITPTHLKHLESEHRKPSIDVLFSMVDILNLSLDSLFISESQYNVQEKNILEINLMLAKCQPIEAKAIHAALLELTKGR